MEKPVEAFRTIGEMAEELNVKTHILRYWEEQFPTLKPLKRAGGRRHYRPDDVAILRRINTLLNEEGYTIKGARKFLANGAPANMSGMPQVASNNSATQGIGGGVNELLAIRNRLAAALEAA